MSNPQTRRLAVLYLVVLGLLALLGVRPVHATILVNTDTRTLAEHSDFIVLGRVAATRARWEQGRIVTDVDVQVDDTVKGTVLRTMRVLAPGGKVGDIAMRVLGAAEFHAGDRSILFLARAGEGLRVVGLVGGKVDVTRDDVVHWVPPGSTVLQAMPLGRALEQLRGMVRTR